MVFRMAVGERKCSGFIVVRGRKPPPLVVSLIGINQVPAHILAIGMNLGEEHGVGHIPDQAQPLHPLRPECISCTVLRAPLPQVRIHRIAS